MRESLRDLALVRIGRTQYAIVANQFFREQLSPECPMISLEAVVTHDGSGRRASGVAVYGVDRRFWEFHQIAQKAPRAGEALLSPALARELGAAPDDTLLVRLPKISAIPTESLQGAKDDPGRTLRTRMREAVSRSAMGEFSLRPVQGDVRAVFLPLDRLQRELGQEDRVNTALLKSAPDLKSAYQLDDIGLHLRGHMLESDSIVLSDAVVRSVLQVDPQAQPVLTYLINVMRANGREVPYSLVAAIDRPDLPDNASILLTDWLRSQLRAEPGDSVQVEYFVWDPSGKLVTKLGSFGVTGFVPVNPADRELAPEYPGISGVRSISDWDPPFPIELKRIRPADEKYWDRYRATPKAYIRLTAGQQQWHSRYGSVTSVRVTPAFSMDALRHAIDPVAAGLAVIPVRQQAEAASEGSTDFGEYFLYFSIFLVISALLLSGLFFRFGLEQRSGEISTLRALGYPYVVLRRLFLTEGMILALIGGMLGILGARGYGNLVIRGLRTWWVDAVGTRDLQLHMPVSAMLLALAASLILAPLVILTGLRAVVRRAPREVVQPQRVGAQVVAAVAAIFGAGLLFVGGPAGFFGAAALFLIAAMLLMSWWLRGTPGQVRSIRGLGLRYTSHRPGRSVLCIALIASATFLVVSAGVFRRDKTEGVPGWRFYGETAIPIYHDPGSSSGREALNLGDAPQAKWLGFRLRPGDDVSCLNLYAPRNPRVLGVPRSFLAFPRSQTDAIPAAVDANTLQYVLHKKIGDIIHVGGAKLQIVQALHDSVFQSEVLIPDIDFRRAFPNEGGFRVFLVDAREGSEGVLESALSDYGLDLTSTADRLAAFHRVENTYLSTFQALGGRGMLLGTLGIGAVILRNIFERRRELALLRAVGYRRGHLIRVTLAETVFLLMSGLLAGVCTALIAVLPATMQRGGSVPVASLLVLLAAVLVTGLAASLVAVTVIARSPLLNALRSE